MSKVVDGCLNWTNPPFSQKAKRHPPYRNILELCERWNILELCSNWNILAMCSNWNILTICSNRNIQPFHIATHSRSIHTA